jgi:hypothetical protein
MTAVASTSALTDLIWMGRPRSHMTEIGLSHIGEKPHRQCETVWCRQNLIHVRLPVTSTCIEANASSRRRRPHGSGAALATIKLVHTLAWLSIESCMVYVLFAGFVRRSDRRAAIAAGVVASETLLFVGNGCRCPLTQVAERLGADRGSVTDIYLPRWLARNLPTIHVPLIVLAAYLHARNRRSPR